MRDVKSSLKWITDILARLNIPYQIAGGLAAIAYGANRELADIDIDIPEDKFDTLKEHVSDYITFGPSRYKDDHWDLLLMTLNHHGQEIDIGGAHQTHLFCQSTRTWHKLSTDFSKSISINIYDLTLPVIARQYLIEYKTLLARPVDLIDIEQLSRT